MIKTFHGCSMKSEEPGVVVPAVVRLYDEFHSTPKKPWTVFLNGNVALFRHGWGITTRMITLFSTRRSNTFSWKCFSSRKWRQKNKMLMVRLGLVLANDSGVVLQLFNFPWNSAILRLCFSQLNEFNKKSVFFERNILICLEAISAGAKINLN